MGDRDKILKKLRGAPKPFADLAPVSERRHVVPMAEMSSAELQERFVREATALGCTVNTYSDAQQVIERLLQIVSPDTSILSWDFAHIPLPGLAEAVARAGVSVVQQDAAVRVGVSGADAAAAATGSLVLMAGPGKARAPSSLPPIHIAVIRNDQIVPDLETWATRQHLDNYERFRSSSNTVIISGPSRTGDIANIPVKGVHGPGTVYVLILSE